MAKAEVRVQGVEAARAQEAAEYRELTLSTVYIDATAIHGLVTR